MKLGEREEGSQRVEAAGAAVVEAGAVVAEMVQPAAPAVGYDENTDKDSSTEQLERAVPRNELAICMPQRSIGSITHRAYPLPHAIVNTDAKPLPFNLKWSA